MRRFVTMADAKRGAFVVFEGIDRCGKSTQAKKLVDFLNNRLPTKLYRFPGIQLCRLLLLLCPENLLESPQTEQRQLASFLTSTLPTNKTWMTKGCICFFQPIVGSSSMHHCLCSLFLFLVSWAGLWHWCRDEIELCLKRGVHVICDRYAYSGVAFSAAKVTNAGATCCPFFALSIPQLTLKVGVGFGVVQKPWQRPSCAWCSFVSWHKCGWQHATWRIWWRYRLGSFAWGTSMNRMRCMLHDSCNQSLLSYLFNGVKERYEKKVFQEQVLHCYSQLKDPSWKVGSARITSVLALWSEKVCCTLSCVVLYLLLIASLICSTDIGCKERCGRPSHRGYQDSWRSHQKLFKQGNRKPLVII